MFRPIEQRFEKHVVVGDVHGEHHKLSKVVEKFHDDEGVGFVILGDIIDRKGVSIDKDEGVRRCLEIIKTWVTGR